MLCARDWYAAMRAAEQRRANGPQLTLSTRLQNMAELAQSMAHYSPATGYSYFPPTFEAPKASTGSRAGSTVGSPSLAPMDVDQTQATATTAAAPEEATDEFSDGLFLTSLRMMNQYGDEYMDENPLKGEPGSFVFTNTKNAVDERNKAQEAASSLLNAPKVDTQPPSVAATPLPAATPAAVESHSRKGSVAPEKEKKKKERRKSKGLASPTTPGPGVPPTPTG